MGAVGYTEAIGQINLNMLDVFGKSYVIDSCIAFFTRRKKEQDFRDYVGNALYVIAQNTSNMFGGSHMAIKYTDLYKPQDERSAEQVIGGIKDKLKRMGDS